MHPQWMVMTRNDSCGSPCRPSEQSRRACGLGDKIGNKMASTKARPAIVTASAAEQSGGRAGERRDPPHLRRGQLRGRQLRRRRHRPYDVV